MLLRIKLLAVALFVCLLTTQGTQAALVISSIEFGDPDPTDSSIATSLTFDLEGTIEGEAVGENSRETLFIGALVDGDWFNGDLFENGFANGSWTQASDPFQEGTIIPTSLGVNQHSTAGDYATIVFQEHTLAGGDAIDGTFSVTGGSFNPGNTTTSDWLVSAGWNNFSFPDSDTVTGAAVPEPTSFALLLIAFALLGLRRISRAVPAWH